MGKVPDNNENAPRCMCKMCPSFAANPDFYCARGKAAKVDRKGCLCGGCPVHAQYVLNSGYYCASGKA